MRWMKLEPIIQSEASQKEKHQYSVKWSEGSSLSRVRLFVTPWTVAHQAVPSMGFSRQGYLSGFPFPSPGELPNPGIEPRSPALQADALTSEPPGKPMICTWYHSNGRKWKVKGKLLSRVRLFVIPWTAAYQTPPFMGLRDPFSKVTFPWEILKLKC